MKHFICTYLSTIIVALLCFTAIKVTAAEKERFVRIDPSYHKFTLTNGKGIEVCEAYLERLHKTWFDRVPFCDRPENIDIKGFEKLNRVYLSPKEIYPLYYRVWGFLEGHQYAYDEKARQIDLKPEEMDSLINAIKQSIGNRDLNAYRYEPSVDLDNDGVADNLLIWKQHRCGSIEGVIDYPSRGVTIVLVLATDSRSIDEIKTKQLIGHPIGGYPKPDNKGFYEKFRPINNYMGVFRYKNITYFDTFFDSWGDYVGKRRNDPNIARMLGVFKREKGQTKQVCEYLWEIPYETINKK